MYEHLKNKHIKVVWNDGSFNKAVSGILKDVEDSLIGITTDSGNNIIIAKAAIVSIMEREQR